MTNPRSLRALDDLITGMWECVTEDAGGDVNTLDMPDPSADDLVDAALWAAGRMLWLAATDGVDAGRSRRWQASVERLALRIDGLRTGEGA